jgi:hypothetical protein
MNQQWGRNAYVGEWPTRQPAWTIATALVGLGSVVMICAYQYTEIWTPLQRLYLSPYLRSAVALTTSGQYDLHRRRK